MTCFELNPIHMFPTPLHIFSAYIALALSIVVVYIDILPPNSKSLFKADNILSYFSKPLQAAPK